MTVKIEFNVVGKRSELVYSTNPTKNVIAGLKRKPINSPLKKIR